MKSVKGLGFNGSGTDIAAKAIARAVATAMVAPFCDCRLVSREGLEEKSSESRSLSKRY